MPDHTDLRLLRHRAVRLAVLAGTTLTMSLSLAPASQAMDGGLLDDVTDVAGDVTEPGVDPALEAVETVVPPVEHAVEAVTEHVVEPTASEVEHVVEATGGGSAAPGGQPPVQVEGDGPTTDPGADPGAGPGAGPGNEPGSEPGDGPGAPAIDPVTASQPPGATPTPPPAGPGNSDDDTGVPGRGDESGTPAADPLRGRQRPSPASCDRGADLPPRGAAAPVAQRRDVGTAEPAQPGETDTRSADRSDSSSTFLRPGNGALAPAVAAPDASRALWLAGLVGLGMMLAMSLTVVLARELE